MAQLDRMVASDSGFDITHWQRQRGAKGSFTYVAEQESIFGFASIGSAGLPDEGIGEVFGLWIDPAYRRQRWGRKLLVRGLTGLKRTGCHAAHTYVNPKQRSIESLLLDLDFVRLLEPRLVNQGGDSLSQSGFALDLKDYF